MNQTIANTLRLFSCLCLVAVIWVTPAPAQEPGKIMVMPLKAKTVELERNLPDFAARLREYFGDNSRIVLLGDDQLQSLLGATTGPSRQLVQVAGEKLDCTSALQITLERYRERLGDEYSATDSASLAFAYQLLNVADGKVICFGQFDETQKPVSDNVLDIGQALKRGFKWITIADLTTEALKRKFSSCPGLAAADPAN
jgi:hypothetical protein